MTPQEFAQIIPVSRETLDKLIIYAETLERWQGAINLVGPKTLPELWSRHFLDSAQLWGHLPPNCPSLVDFGSGAGFPAMILAIMGVPDVHMIESDMRKSMFLQEVARQTSSKVTIHNQRIERVKNLEVAVVTARAFASVEEILPLAVTFLSEKGEIYLLKGKNYQEELTQARKAWHIKEEIFPSLSDPSGRILKLKEVRRDCSGNSHSQSKRRGGQNYHRN